MSLEAAISHLGTEPHRRPYSFTRKQLIILGLFPLSEAIAWTTIFPYIYSMVQSFSLSKADDENSAIYAGIMVSVFTFGEFIMAPQWARLSDKIGRKPTLLIGSVGAMFSAIFFGFSISLPWAIVARTFAGLLNPNLGVVQTFVGELVPKEEQAKGFSVVPFLRSFGTIIGPVIGGYLAEPVRNHPSLFARNSIWDRYPFLLPNLVVVGFLFGSALIGFLYLEEVHPKFRGQPFTTKKFPHNALKAFLRGRPWDNSPRYSAVDTDEPAIEPMHASLAVSEEREEGLEAIPSAWSYQVMLQIGANAILGFIKIAILAMIPIFLATPASPAHPSDSSTASSRPIHKIFTIRGGFGLNTTGISNVLLSQAIATIISQIFAIPVIITRIGALRSYRFALIILSFIFLLMPFAAELPTWASMTAILVSLWIYALVNGLASTCSAILITNTVPDPIHLAKINGAAASLGCLARTLGPAISGPLFRLGLQIGCIGLPFWAMSIVTGLGIFISVFQRDYA